MVYLKTYFYPVCAKRLYLLVSKGRIHRRIAALRAVSPCEMLGYVVSLNHSHSELPHLVFR